MLAREDLLNGRVGADPTGDPLPKEMCEEDKGAGGLGSNAHLPTALRNGHRNGLRSRLRKSFRERREEVICGNSLDLGQVVQGWEEFLLVPQRAAKQDCLVDDAV
jgi:hypothetical protein